MTCLNPCLALPSLPHALALLLSTPLAICSLRPAFTLFPLSFALPRAVYRFLVEFIAFLNHCSTFLGSVSDSSYFNLLKCISQLFLRSFLSLPLSLRFLIVRVGGWSALCSNVRTKSLCDAICH